MFFFSDALPDGARNIHPVYAPVEKLGPVLESTEPWELPRNATFASSIVRGDDSRYRMYYTTLDRSLRRMAIALAESDDGLTWGKPLLGQVSEKGQDTNRFAFEGIPLAQDFMGQPQVLRLRDGRWRMYFWFHGGGRLRYLVAESDDGLRWTVGNFEKPALYHPADLGRWAWEAGKRPGDEDLEAAWRGTAEELLAHKALKTNDATFVYFNDCLDRFECYSVWLLPAVADRRVEVDNCPIAHRTIQRRLSDDGLRWSQPDLLLLPDANDPWDQQFYHLAVQWHEDWMIGSLGHYRVEDGQQTQELELCFSRDGRKWHRPLRGGFIPRAPESSDEWDTLGIYPPNAWFDLGDRWLCLYTGTRLRHNESPEDDETHGGILGATFGKNRFIGLDAGAVTGGLLTEPFFPRGDPITIDADVRGWLRAELCDAFGRKMEGYHLMDSTVTEGDCEVHVLRWGERDPSVFAYDAVRLRFEFADATVYGVGY